MGGCQAPDPVCASDFLMFCIFMLLPYPCSYKLREIAFESHMALDGNAMGRLTSG